MHRVVHFPVEKQTVTNKKDVFWNVLGPYVAVWHVMLTVTVTTQTGPFTCIAPVYTTIK